MQAIAGRNGWLVTKTGIRFTSVYRNAAVHDVVLGGGRIDDLRGEWSSD